MKPVKKEEKSFSETPRLAKIAFYGITPIIMKIISIFLNNQYHIRCFTSNSKVYSHKNIVSVADTWILNWCDALVLFESLNETYINLLDNIRRRYPKLPIIVLSLNDDSKFDSLSMESLMISEFRGFNSENQLWDSICFQETRFSGVDLKLLLEGEANEG